MKKYWHTEKYKKYVKKKVRKAAKLLRKRKNKHKQKLQTPNTQYIREKKTKERRYQINAPEDFSIINNPDSMLDMIREFKENARLNRRIFLDMSKVTSITSDGILSILSLLDYAGNISTSKISGNIPYDNYCFDLFYASGFYDYVSHGVNRKAENKNILSIKKGDNVKSTIAGDVIKFSLSHLKELPSTLSRRVYSTIIECMCNTKNHAYTDMHKSHLWWLNAIYNEREGVVRFTFLDNGKGIPTTVKKKFKEIFFKVPDEELLKSAFIHGVRSRSNELGRGKGLPAIYSHLKKGQIKNLIVISNNGYANFEKNIFKKLDINFSGTMLCWDLVKVV